MTGECSYNCSEHPKEVQFDADITGIGILISYIATAGLVTIIIVLHYFLAYRPTLDPFRHDDGRANPSATFLPNPVDTMILKVVQRKSKSPAKVSRSKHWNWSRLDSSITKCVLSMSDLQLATGIAILVSGYAQLPCGLSCYHWLVIGRLAWFSSLTHLSCLTLLRNYLHNRPAQRQWRLISMLVLVIMMVVAMIPTGTYEWSVDYHESSPEPSDYAICYFSQSPLMGTAAAVSMSIFVVSSILGFLVRVVKLYQTLSLFLVSRPRKILSKHARNFLWKLYKQQKAQRLPWCIVGNTCYLATLALFLAMRVLLDHWASMYFEVYWLLISFLYGLFNLLVDINVFTSEDIIKPIIQSNYSNRWSFGQIMPVVLLAVPFITIIELFYSDETEKTSAGQNLSSQSNVSLMYDDNTLSTQNLALETVRPELSFILDPDQDYYHLSTALKSGNLFIILIEIAIGTAVLVMTGARDSVARFLVRSPWLEMIAIVFCLLWAVLFLSFLIDWTVDQKILRRYVRKSRLLVILQTVNVTAFTGVFIYQSLMIVLEVPLL